MCDEYKALIDNETWVLVPRPPNVNIVHSMWLYKHKYNADGSLSWYKARLVVNGRSQQKGIDYDETFSPVVKPATIRTVLSLAVSRQWLIHQLDVKNVFLHCHLTETVYMHQPPGFTDSAHPDYVCLLQKLLYGLKQAPKLGFSDFLAMLFEPVSITAKPTRLFSSFTRGQRRLTYYYLGPLNYFLGISATCTTSGIFLSQTKYATEILERAHMLNCNPYRIPVDTEKKLGPEGSPDTNPTYIAALPEHFSTAPTCLNAMKRVLRYLRGIADLGLQLFWSTTSQLTAYSDADWARDKLSRSSVEAEYHGVANGVAETSWIRNLLRELHTLLFTVTLVYHDNVSTVYMSANPGGVIAISQSIVLSLVSTPTFPSWILFV
uniref:Reverse transcriptase Ty1/copia-type domain-containing protein n=1 Tax=Tanacetum cinerariifolium TaxID=118510 RepID=A0A699HHW0_TANCI|nr:hypothetical protein [Tanacetum cinerariifolium]